MTWWGVGAVVTSDLRGRVDRPIDVVAIIGQLGFALVDDVLYVRVLVPGKKRRPA